MVNTSCEWAWEIGFVQVRGWNIHCVFSIVSYAFLDFSWGGQAIQVDIQIFSRYEIAQISLAVFGTVYLDSSFITLSAVLFQEVKQIFV